MRSLIIKGIPIVICVIAFNFHIASAQDVNQNTKMIASGNAQLVNGKCHVDLKESTTMILSTNEAGEHSDRLPLVFVQPMGKCNGLFVDHRTQKGFDVIEQFDGKSNISFSWYIIPESENDTGNNISPSESDINNE